MGTLLFLISVNSDSEIDFFLSLACLCFLACCNCVFVFLRGWPRVRWIGLVFDSVGKGMCVCEGLWLWFGDCFLRGFFLRAIPIARRQSKLYMANTNVHMSIWSIKTTTNILTIMYNVWNTCTKSAQGIYNTSL